MSLTRCKECNNEVSTEANTCPYCGVDHPGVIENNNHRRVGVIVLALLFFLFLYFLTKHEKVDNQATKTARISENTKTGMSKVVQVAPAVRPILEAPVMEDSTQPQQASSVQLTQRSPVSQEQPEQEKLKPDKTKAASSTDTPQIMVKRMLEYALIDGGLSHESEILKTKLQIERSSKPVKGNKKAARAINAEGL
ncbi:MAG: zinc ribbon domain-containing protein, partial [Methylococcales bacterium]|nr:zinc ribbon domain-containing protein [Methylococcales bacterium]